MNFFSRVKGLKLLKSSDTLKMDLENKFGREFLVDVETRISYIAGKLNERLNTQKFDVKETLRQLPIGPDMDKYEPTRQLAQFLKQEKFLSMNNNLDTSTNRFALPAEVFTLKNKFNEQQKFEEIVSAGKIAINQYFGFQTSSVALGLLSYYLFDVPELLFGISGAAILSMSGFIWLRIRWSIVRQQLQKQIDQLRDELKKNLLNTFVDEVKKNIQPTRDQLKVCMDVVKDKQLEVKEIVHRLVDIEKQIDALEKEISITYPAKKYR